MTQKKKNAVLSIRIETVIRTIREERVILDTNLARIYDIPTYRLNEAVKRNRDRFPDDFMFQLNKGEQISLTSQIAMSKSGRGGRRTLPYAFTEHGAVMAASSAPMEQLRELESKLTQRLDTQENVIVYRESLYAFFLQLLHLTHDLVSTRTKELFMIRRFVSSLLLSLFAFSLLFPASRAPIRARHGMVVASDQLAAEAGVSMLRQGGNAVDAAVATGFALAVTYPGAGNIGGGGFMVIRMADGKSLAIDYRETAPAAARRDMYLDANGTVKSSKITYGHLAAGVPGSVAGLLLALEKFGTMDRARVLQPAIDLAEKGFALDYRLAYSLEESLKNFSSFPGSMKSFSKNGVPYAEGELFRQPELAATLRLIAEKGNDGFYRGRTADLIVAEMKRGHGIITHEDLEKYTPVFREPVRGTYKDYDIISMPPPSSGGIALIELLNILEGYPLHQYGWNSSRYAHCLTEAERRVYADRAEFLGDPDFVSVPTTRLISKEYAAEQRALIDTMRASISDSVKHGSMPGYESPQTTHYSVADSAGNCVSVTTTLNSSYGCKLVVEGAGFLLNNEMDDFSAKPGVPNIYGLVGSTANAIMPGKRMLSSMTPTIVLKDGRPWLIVGSPGGSQIITTVLQTILNMIDFRMDVQEAVDAPRFHHQWLPDKLTFEHRAFQTDVVERLSSLGHRLDETGPNMGSVQAIFFDEKHGLLLGASDPRGYGEAVGY